MHRYLATFTSVPMNADEDVKGIGQIAHESLHRGSGGPSLVRS
jgi:hypothetical protein